MQHVVPIGKSGKMILLGLVCPKTEFWEIEQNAKPQEIGVYRDISQYLVPKVQYNVSKEDKQNKEQSDPAENVKTTVGDDTS